MTKPKLGESAPKVSYQAGDRVLARLGSFPDGDTIRKIKKAINSYAGVELNCLVIDCSTVTLLLERGGGIQCLAGPKYLKLNQLASKVTYSFGVSKLELQKDDRFYLSTLISSTAVINTILKQVSHWVGEHEVILLPWKEYS